MNEFTEFMGKQIKKVRKEQKVFIEDLAHGMNLSPQTIRNIEQGKRKVTADELVQLMDFFEKDLDYFTDRFQTDDIDLHISKEKNGY